MKKILIAIDDKPGAQKVAETGHKLAKALKARVTLAFVIADLHHYTGPERPVMGFSGFTADTAFRRTEEQYEQAIEYLNCVKQHLEDPSIITRVLEGSPVRSLLNLASKWKADLIVAGSLRHHHPKEFSLGGVSQDLTHQSDFPVLIVPTEGSLVALESETDWFAYQ